MIHIFHEKYLKIIIDGFCNIKYSIDRMPKTIFPEKAFCIVEK